MRVGFFKEKGRTNISTFTRVPELLARRVHIARAHIRAFAAASPWGIIARVCKSVLSPISLFLFLSLAIETFLESTDE